MPEYKIIALDMDGTVLSDDKKIGERTSRAIHAALSQGKEVVFCTGRSLAEMSETLREFPDMHYLCCASGSMVYDLTGQCIMKTFPIEESEIQLLRETAAGRDIMLHFLCEGRCVINRSQIDRMDYYQMGVYQKTFSSIATLTEDAFEMVRMEHPKVEKINFFHTSPEERKKSRRMLEEKHATLTMIDSEISALEFTRAGIDKGVGLKALCEKAGIPLQELIMVGDADNDMPALRVAGLAVAMGNANERVKEICDVTVADNNHDGCAEAIWKYLLGGN